MPFSTINKISISVNRSNFTLIFFEADSHAKPGAAIKRARPISYISRHIFGKFSNTFANNNISL